MDQNYPIRTQTFICNKFNRTRPIQQNRIIRVKFPIHCFPEPLIPRSAIVKSNLQLSRSVSWGRRHSSSLKRKEPNITMGASDTSVCGTKPHNYCIIAHAHSSIYAYPPNNTPTRTCDGGGEAKNSHHKHTHLAGTYIYIYV